jgi:hypothetical protein
MSSHHRHARASSFSKETTVSMLVEPARALPVLRRVRRRRGRRRAGRPRRGGERGAPRRAHACSSSATASSAAWAPPAASPTSPACTASAERRDDASWCTAWPTSSSQRLDAMPAGLNKPQDGMQRPHPRALLRHLGLQVRRRSSCCSTPASQLLFHAWALRPCMMDGARIAALVVETKSGRQAIRANAFVDGSWRRRRGRLRGRALRGGRRPRRRPCSRPPCSASARSTRRVPWPRWASSRRSTTSWMPRAHCAAPVPTDFPRDGAILRPQDRPARMARQRHADPQCRGPGDERRRRAAS